MAAPAVKALPMVIRAISKPKVFKRFLGTKAGKRAMLKYGTMLLRSKSAQNTISKFVSKNDKQMTGNKEYEESKQKYEQLQKRIAELEKQLDAARDNQSQMETLTFTLGRQVVQMQQLLADMQYQQNEYFKQMLNAQKTR